MSEESRKGKQLLADSRLGAIAMHRGNMCIGEIETIMRYPHRPDYITLRVDGGYMSADAQHFIILAESQQKHTS